MAEREYKFDAFISYRHCELDKFVAENLHKILETYDLPKSIKKKLNLNDKAFKRVFRDQEELPLSSNLEDPIIEALKDSKYLIVICSPRLKDSLWCKKEIQTFKKLRGRKNIFCVLIEGEPSDSFPEEVLSDEVEVFKNGKMVKETVPVEPLAADVRGKNNKEVLKKIKEEKLRLIAPMFNLDYDDLKQRQKIREQKRIITIAVSVAVFSVLFAIYSLAMFIKINTQQNILATHQALALANQSVEYYKQDDKYNSVKSAYEALTEFEDVEMPYTSEAEYALSESLGVYDVGSSYKAVNEIKTNGVASYIKSSFDEKYAAVYDESDTVTLFESNTLKVLYTDKTTSKNVNNNTFSFIGSNYLAYVNKDNNISIVDLTNSKVIKTIDKKESNYFALRGSSNGELLTYVDNNNLYIYSVKEDKLLGTVASSDKYSDDLYFSEDDKYVFAFTTKTSSVFDIDINKKYYLTIHTISVDSVQEINSKQIDGEYFSGLLVKGNNVYVVINNLNNANYQMLLVSYNYINGTVNWSKDFDNSWGNLISRSYKEGTNDIAVANYKTLRVFNADSGKLVETFDMDDEIIDVYAFLNNDTYLVFLKNGSVIYASMTTHNQVLQPGKYVFNLGDYNKVLAADTGFILLPTSENRVILYGESKNNDVEEYTGTVESNKTSILTSDEMEKVKEEYPIINKSLTKTMFYDDNKELLFINYTNQDLAIYSVKEKRLLKLLNKVGTIIYYYGKDKYNRIYIGDLYDAYILDKDYNKVGHIDNLDKVDNDKVIISSNSKHYSIKVYELKDLLDIAEKYLENK